MKILKVKGGETVLDDKDYLNYKDLPWRISKEGYVCFRRGMKETVFLHRLVAQTPEGYVTDHINGCRVDNLRANLRITTDKHNRENSGKRHDNTSGYKGVWFRKNTGRWQAETKLNGKKFSLGCYDTAEQAAAAYNKKALELFGEYAKINEIEK